MGSGGAIRDPQGAMAGGVEGWDTPPSWAYLNSSASLRPSHSPPSSARPHRWNQLDLAIVLLSVIGHHAGGD